MSYLPCYCGSCGFVTLVVVEKAPDSSPCSKCGARLAVLPGALHSEQDLAIFHELSELVHGSLSVGAAQALVAELEEIETEPARTILTRVSVRAPQLALTLAAFIESDRAWRTVTMVLTILRGRALTRTHSGFLPTFEAQEAEGNASQKRR